jgi:hypothetical protein
MLLSMLAGARTAQELELSSLQVSEHNAAEYADIFYHSTIRIVRIEFFLRYFLCKNLLCKNLKIFGSKYSSKSINFAADLDSQRKNLDLREEFILKQSINLFWN